MTHEEFYCLETPVCFLLLGIIRIPVEKGTESFDYLICAVVNI